MNWALLVLHRLRLLYLVLEIWKRPNSPPLGPSILTSGRLLEESTVLGQQHATLRSLGYHGSGLKFSILFGSEYVCGPLGACGLGFCYACVLGWGSTKGEWKSSQDQSSAQVWLGSISWSAGGGSKDANRSLSTPSAVLRGHPLGYSLMELLSRPRRMFGAPLLQWKSCPSRSWMRTEMAVVGCVVLSFCSCLFVKTECVTMFLYAW